MNIEHLQRTIHCINGIASMFNVQPFQFIAKWNLKEMLDSMNLLYINQSEGYLIFIISNQHFTISEMVWCAFKFSMILYTFLCCLLTLKFLWCSGKWLYLVLIMCNIVTWKICNLKHSNTIHTHTHREKKVNFCSSRAKM